MAHGHLEVGKQSQALPQWEHDLPSGSSGLLSHFPGLGQRTGFSRGDFFQGSPPGLSASGHGRGKGGRWFLAFQERMAHGVPEVFPKGT